MIAAPSAAARRRAAAGALGAALWPCQTGTACPAASDHGIRTASSATLVSLVACLRRRGQWCSCCKLHFEVQNGTRVTWRPPSGFTELDKGVHGWDKGVHGWDIAWAYNAH